MEAEVPESSLETPIKREKRYKICDICGKEFSNIYTLSDHKKLVHEKIKDHQCSICGALFATKHKAFRHFQGVHSDTRNFQCEVENCGGKFKTKDMLMKHQRTHFVGPFKCGLCETVFKFKSGLDYHISQKHREDREDEPFYCCLECLKSFKSSVSLEKHIKIHEIDKEKDQEVGENKQKFECQYCFKRYKCKDSFHVHLASHENSEDMKDYEYITENQQMINERLIDEETPEYLLKHIDEDLVSIVKFETTKYVGDPENEYSQPENASTVEDLQETDDLIEEQFDESNFAYEESQDYFEETVVEELDSNFFVDDFSHLNDEMVEASDGSQKTLSRSKNDKSCICEECGRSFSNRSQMKRHIFRTHQKANNKYECDYCGAKFLLNYDLKRHMSKHSSVRSFNCINCEKAFKTAISLKNHVAVVHSEKGEPKHQCQECSRSYFHQRHLEYHMRMHTGDHRYKCDLCEKTFHYSDAVKWHKIRHHRQPAPFYCSSCGKRFIHEKTWANHEKEHQELGTIAVTCPICGKSVSEKRHLKRHLRTHEDKKHKCNCGESFKERHQLSKHVKTCKIEYEEEEVLYEFVDNETSWCSTNVVTRDLETDIKVNES